MRLRKIETAEEKRKRERNRNIILGVLLVLVMILSTAGYAIRQEKEETLKYKEFVFIKEESGWRLQKPFSLLTRFNPKQVEGIGYNSRMQKDDFANQNVYLVAFSTDEKMAADEIFRNLPVSHIQLACFEEDANKTECADLPLKNCFDDRILAVKIIRDENETVVPRAFQQNKCLFIESDSANITMVGDRVLFSLYGIM